MKITKIFALYILSISFSCFANIYQINNIDDIKPYLHNVGLRQLVIFDVDDVLIQPKDQLLKSCNKKHLNNLMKDSETKYSHEEFENIWSIMWNSHEVQFVDPTVIKIIYDLQESGTTTIALTKANTGKYGVIESIEKHRVKQLHDLGIQFHALIEDKIYTSLQCKYYLGNPSHYQGIFFTCGLEKQLVLELAIQDIGYIPEKIIFIDDHIDNLENIFNYCKLNNIKFVGLHYVAVSKLPVNHIDLDIIKQQINVLHINKKWLPDSHFHQIL